LLVIAGVILLIYGGLTLIIPSNVLDLGDVSITIREDLKIPLPPVVGAMFLIVGIVLVLSVPAGPPPPWHGLEACAGGSDESEIPASNQAGVEGRAAIRARDYSRRSLHGQDEARWPHRSRLAAPRLSSSHPLSEGLSGSWRSEQRRDRFWIQVQP